jgi:hypothetical protein
MILAELSTRNPLGQSNNHNSQQSLLFGQHNPLKSTAGAHTTERDAEAGRGIAKLHCEANQAHELECLLTGDTYRSHALEDCTVVSTMSAQEPRIDHLSRLPAELRLEIVHFLRKTSDRKSLSLVSKEWENVVLPEL